MYHKYDDSNAHCSLFHAISHNTHINCQTNSLTAINTRVKIYKEFSFVRALVTGAGIRLQKKNKKQKMFQTGKNSGN